MSKIEHFLEFGVNIEDQNVNLILTFLQDIKKSFN